MDPRLMTEELVRDEAIRLKPYLDSLGIYTIGVGRNLSDNGISRDEAMILLFHDIEKATADLDSRYPWWRNMNEPRQRAVVNMCFNLGIKRLATFKNTMHYLETGQYAVASEAMLDSLWAKQVGIRAVRLARMILTGEEPEKVAV